MDKLHAMGIFVRVVEAGSFSAVAHELNTTQSAISKQVAALEQALGARLLQRTTRSLALTDEGGRYFTEARRLVAEVREAEAELRKGEQQLAGLLRVAASVGFGRLKLMPLVQSFLAAHPDVKIDLRLSDGMIDLVEQGIDVAVRLGELPDSGLLARKVSGTRRVLLAHRSYVRSPACRACRRTCWRITASSTPSRPRAMCGTSRPARAQWKRRARCSPCRCRATCRPTAAK